MMPSSNPHLFTQCDRIECAGREDWLEKRKHYLTASDIAVPLGVSKWKTPTQLWEEKTGLAKAPDLSGNPAVQRGVEREPLIREAFIKHHPGLAVFHHQYTIYTRGIFGATLDGEVRIEDEELEEPGGFPTGAKGILEIKSVGLGSPDEEWREVPMHYLAQLLCQMHVTGADFAYFVVEFSPRDAGAQWGPFTKEWLIEPDLQAVQGTLRSAEQWWRQYVETKTPPPTLLGFMGGNDMDINQLLVVQADVKEPSFEENFDLIKAQVAQMVEPYRGVVVTDQSYSGAKAVRANLNKLAKQINDSRLAVQKKAEAPIKAFKAKADEVIAVINEVADPLKDRIAEYEAEQDAAKTKDINDMVDHLLRLNLADEERDVFLARGFQLDKKWLNRSTTLSAIRKEVESSIKLFQQDYDSVRKASVSTEAKVFMLDSFRKGASAAEAIASGLSYEAQLAQYAEAQAEASKEKEPQEPCGAREEPATEAAPAPAPAADDDKNPKPMYAFTFEAMHPSQEEWKALIQYMRDHGFIFKQVK